jgi:hypothetical protein
MISNFLKSIFKNAIIGESFSVVRQSILLGTIIISTVQILMSSTNLHKYSDYKYVKKAYNTSFDENQKRSPASLSASTNIFKEKEALIKVKEYDLNDNTSTKQKADSESFQNSMAINEPKERRFKTRSPKERKYKDQSEFRDEQSALLDKVIEAQTSGFDIITNLPFDNNTTDGEPEANSTFNCSYSKPQGKYTSGFDVILSCSEGAIIRYCLQVGGGFCSPLTSPSLYNKAISLSLNNSTYGLSFYGESNSGNLTDVIELNYIIASVDTTAPSLTVNFPKINIQTTQLPLKSEVHSIDFGKNDFYYHQINFKSHNPTSSGLNWSCRQLLDDHTSLTLPSTATIESNFTLSSVLSGNHIDQNIDLPRLAPGDNYIITFIENRSNSIVSCQTQKIIVKDFFISYFGNFNIYGHYQESPNASPSGEKRNTQETVINENGLKTIIH